jgi:hypothetical protein
MVDSTVQIRLLSATAALLPLTIFDPPRLMPGQTEFAPFHWLPMRGTWGNLTTRTSQGPWHQPHNKPQCDPTIIRAAGARHTWHA